MASQIKPAGHNGMQRKGLDAKPQALVMFSGFHLSCSDRWNYSGSRLGGGLLPETLKRLRELKKVNSVHGI